MKSNGSHALKSFLRVKTLTATQGLLIEPYQGSNPSISMMKEMTNNNREKLRRHGVLLLCDEVITGFRERYGSCNSSRKVNPDIVIFGKTAALGFPVGLVLVDRKTTSQLNELPFWEEHHQLLRLRYIFEKIVFN